MLCGYYRDLTDSHILPRSVGNNITFRAYGYNTTSSGAIEKTLPRTFKGGVSFMTLCVECNSSLGGSEDQVIKGIFDQVTVAMKPSSLIINNRHLLLTKPNRLFRAVLACFATANDTGFRTKLDDQIKGIFEGSLKALDSPLKIYYWPYMGPWLTVVRDVFVSYEFLKDPKWMNVIKFKPMGFVVTESHKLFDLPCLNSYLSNYIDESVNIPIFRNHRETNIHWPANPGPKGAVFCTSESPNFVAAASWRNIKPKLQ